MNITPRIKIQTRKAYPQKHHISVPLLLVTAAALALALLTGCASSGQDKKKLKDVDYTILEDRDLPEKLAEIIEQKKEAEFKLSFTTDNDLYLVHGYGEQETGGYSIVVRDLFLTENALYFDTELLGPENGSDPPKKPSYPYIVVKTKKYKQNIVFE